MRIDKSDPRHWLYLALFALNTLLAIILRPFTAARRRNSPTRHIIMYGHRLAGNLLALHRHISKDHGAEFQLTFLTMDPEYHKTLCNEGLSACRPTQPSAIRLMCTADAVISDHGLHSMLLLLYFSDVEFFDVWHGLPFKGFDENEFKTLHRYTETWVASTLMAKIYEEKLGFPREKICVTGYARTDPLVRPQEPNHQIQKRFGLQYTKGKKIVLFAPTWKQDSNDRTLFPFGATPENFLRDICRTCRKQNAVLVVRAHINAELPESIPQEGIKFLPFGEFPDTESLLQITDVLICDWSSIAFDYMLLNRPTIFLDVPPPFANGFTLTPDYRYGEVVCDLDNLYLKLDEYLQSETSYWNDNRERHEYTKRLLYGANADGNSAHNCVARLHALLPK